MVLGLGVLAVNRLAARPWFRPRLEVLLTVVPIALAGTYVAQVIATWIEWWGLVGAVAVPPLRPAWAGLTLGSPNLVATLLILTTPVSVALVLARWPPAGMSHRTDIVAAVAIGTLGLAATALTGSRGGALGAATVIGLVVIVIVLRSSTRRLPFLLAGLGGIVLLGAALVSRMAQGGGDLRLELWRASLEMVLDRPLVGVGPGAWGVARLAEAQPWVPTLVVIHAHNLVLHTFAELGLVGVMAGLVLVLTVGRVLRRGLRAGGERALVAGAVALGLVGVAVQSTVDVVTNLAGIVLLMAMLVSIAEHPQPACPEERRSDREPDGSGDQLGSAQARLGRWQPGVAAVVLASAIVGAIGIVWWVARTDLAIARAETARVALRDGDPGAAAAGFAEAIALDDHPLYRIEWAVALAHTRDPGALAASEVAVSLDALPHHQVRLADLRLLDGDVAGSVAAVRAALDAGWPDPNVLLNGGRIAEAAGDRQLAADAYVRAAAAAPLTLADPFWAERDDVVAYDDLVDRAAEVARLRSGDRAEVLVLAYGGRARDALAIVATLDSADRAVLGALVVAAEDPAAGIAELERYVAASPSDWFAAASLASLLAVAGRSEQADHYARRAMIVQADAYSYVVGTARRITGPLEVPQFRLSGSYPWPVYQRYAIPVLLGPDALVVAP